MFNEIHPAIQKFMKGFYVWADTTDNQPNPGAEAAAFIKQMLPLYEWDGPGEPFLIQLRAQNAPVYVSHMVIPTGIAGIVAGQIYNPQLSDVAPPPSTG